MFPVVLIFRMVSNVFGLSSRTVDADPFPPVRAFLYARILVALKPPSSLTVTRRS